MVRIVRAAARFAVLIGAVAIVGWLPAGLVLAQGKAPAAKPAAAPATTALIDLNSATRDDLMGLEGIGEVRADAIIRSRPFRAKTELVERHIIPESLYEKLSDKVTARPVPVAPAAAPTRPVAPQGQPKR